MTERRNSEDWLRTPDQSAGRPDEEGRDDVVVMTVDRAEVRQAEPVEVLDRVGDFGGGFREADAGQRRPGPR